jgi:hypothetical protein
MKRIKPAIASLTFFFTFISLASAAGVYSDRTAIYARVDKVILEPSATAPERIQVWGAFALAGSEDRSSYGPAQRGYLYFSCKAGKEEICRREWADLKSIAGTGQVVGFGGRFQPRPSIRKSKDKPGSPDEYPLNYGIVKISDRMSDYAPIRDILSLPREQN